MNNRGVTKTLIITLVIAILIVIVVIISFLLIKPSTDNNNSNNQACLDLGCSENTKFAGSINSDKFYECNCRYAKTIKEENVICFTTEKEALEKGRVRSEC